MLNSNPYQEVVDDLLKWGLIKPEDKISIKPEDYPEIYDEPIYFCLEQTGRCFSFDPEAGMYPVDYQDFFENEVLKIIANLYEEQFQVEETHTSSKIKEIGESKYLVTIRFREQQISQEMRDFSDFYDVEAITLLVNNILKRLGKTDVFEDLHDCNFLLAPKKVIEEIRKKYHDVLYF